MTNDELSSGEHLNSLLIAYQYAEKVYSFCVTDVVNAEIRRDEAEKAKKDAFDRLEQARDRFGKHSKRGNNTSSNNKDTPSETSVHSTVPSLISERFISPTRSFQQRDHIGSSSVHSALTTATFATSDTERRSVVSRSKSVGSPKGTRASLRSTLKKTALKQPSSHSRSPLPHSRSFDEKSLPSIADGPVQKQYGLKGSLRAELERSSADKEGTARKTRTVDGSAEKEVTARKMRTVDGPEKEVTARKMRTVDGPEKEVTARNMRTVDGSAEKEVTARKMRTVDGPEKEVTARKMRTVDGSAEKEVTARKMRTVDGPDKEVTARKMRTVDSPEKEGASTRQSRTVDPQEREVTSRKTRTLDAPDKETTPPRSNTQESPEREEEEDTSPPGQSSNNNSVKANPEKESTARKSRMFENQDQGAKYRKSYTPNTQGEISVSKLRSIIQDQKQDKESSFSKLHSADMPKLRSPKLRSPIMTSNGKPKQTNPFKVELKPTPTRHDNPSLPPAFRKNNPMDEDTPKSPTQPQLPDKPPLESSPKEENKPASLPPGVTSPINRGAAKKSLKMLLKQRQTIGFLKASSDTQLLSIAKGRTPEWMEQNLDCEQHGLVKNFYLASFGTRTSDKTQKVRVFTLVIKDENNDIAEKCGDPMEFYVTMNSNPNSKPSLRDRAAEALVTPPQKEAIAMFVSPKVALQTSEIYYVGHWKVVEGEKLNPPKMVKGQRRQTYVKFECVGINPALVEALNAEPNPQEEPSD